MALIADILMIAGALGVGFYCHVLARRLSRFTDLERGVGGAVAVLSAQVDDLSRSLKAAQAAASGSGESLKELTTKASEVARRLELQIAAMHDLDPGAPVPDRKAAPPAEAPGFVRAAPGTRRPVPETESQAPARSIFSTQRRLSLEGAQ